MMSRVARFFLLACLVIVVMPVFPATARAQGDLDDPQTGQVTTSLEARGYRVLDVGFAADDQGQPDLSTVYVAMQAVEPQLDTEVTIRQVVFGFSALREAYLDAATLVVALEVEQYWLLFPTSVENFDKWYNELIGFDEFWSPIRRDVRILDTATGEFITEQDFTSKDFTNKDFNGDTPPTPPQEPGTLEESILLQPSTFFLPADGETVAQVLAQLNDEQGRPLSGQDVAFSVVTQGEDPRDLGTVPTNAEAGVAVRPFTASRALGAVLVQAATETQAAAVSLLVEEAPDNRRELFGALTEAYEAEDYEFLAAGTWEGTTYAGVLYHQAYIFSTLDEQSFNRRVANQILRSFGTMRTLYPDATELQNVLEWTDSDREQYLLLHSLPASVFDEWVAGRLTAEDLLSRAQLFIYDSDWNVVRGGKDFIVKSFTPPEDATGVDAPRSVTATLTEEEWGEQHTAGVFRVAVGGSADSFDIAELTGGATGFVLYDNSAVATPLVTWHEGDDESDLSALRLAEGQYILAVEGGPAPASVTLNYVEHQSR